MWKTQLISECEIFDRRNELCKLLISNEESGVNHICTVRNITLQLKEKFFYLNNQINGEKKKPTVSTGLKFYVAWIAEIKNLSKELLPQLMQQLQAKEEDESHVRAIYYSLAESTFKECCEDSKASKEVLNLEWSESERQTNQEHEPPLEEAAIDVVTMTKIGGGCLMKTLKLYNKKMKTKPSNKETVELRKFADVFVVMEAREKDDLPAHLKARDRGRMVFPKIVYNDFLLNLGSGVKRVCFEHGFQDKKLPKFVEKTMINDSQLKSLFLQALSVVMRLKSVNVDESLALSFYRIWSLKMIRALINEFTTAHYQKFSKEGERGKGASSLRDTLYHVSDVKQLGTKPSQRGVKRRNPTTAENSGVPPLPLQNITNLLNVSPISPGDQLPVATKTATSVIKIPFATRKNESIPAVRNSCINAAAAKTKVARSKKRKTITESRIVGLPPDPIQIIKRLPKVSYVPPEGQLATTTKTATPTKTLVSKRGRTIKRKIINDA